MATITAAGSGSGLDIETIISQLVSLEKVPLTNQQAVTKKINTQISDLGNLKSNLSSLQAAAKALSSTDFLSSTKATSTNAGVVGVTATGGANAGIYNLAVSKLASAKSESYMSSVKDSSKTFADLGLSPGASITIGTTSIAIDSTDTLNSLVTKVNAQSSTTNVSASLVKQGDGSFAFTLMGSKTGAVDGDFAVAGLDFLGTKVAGQSAQDAAYTLNGIALTSASNEISDAVPGLTFNLSTTGTSAVTVTSDTDAITKKVQTFVDAYNKVITNASALKDKDGSFQGDAMLRSLIGGLYQSIYQPVSATTATSTLATKDTLAPLTGLGISLTAGNQLTFDSSKFLTALKKDPTSVAKVFADGPANALNKTVSDYLDTSGLVGSRSTILSQSLKTSQDKETRLSGQIDAKATAIRAQYTALDVALAKMKSSLSAMQSMLGTSSN